MSDYYPSKLYALLPDPEQYKNLPCWGGEKEFDRLEEWWEQNHVFPEEIASSSDRVNLNYTDPTCQPQNRLRVKHPISGQEQEIERAGNREAIIIPEFIERETDARKVFWWFWRFFPELNIGRSSTLLEPAHPILPDCSIYSYRSTVSALAGAMYPDGNAERKKHPYLLLFTFSPVQEFIKASRKFLDFWAGSYLLHYLSAKLCWSVAKSQGPDTIITPSLRGQEIIDALLQKEYPEFQESFRSIDPEFDREKVNLSLVTAGFPNTISILVAGKEAAETLGRELGERLGEQWKDIARQVREDIKSRFQQRDFDQLWQTLMADGAGFSTDSQEELRRWVSPSHHGCWEWSKIWEAQIENTWEPYWVAVPLGNPNEDLRIREDENYNFNKNWLAAQEQIAKTRTQTPPPTEAEKMIYETLNVGTWWGSMQARLGQAIQALKNTRVWQIPAAPGNRSTISGQFSAIHPRLNYAGRFQEGAGVPSESMRLFWRAMAEVYPGLFNGSEQLNALELTKRMAWVYGGVKRDLLDRSLESSLSTEEENELALTGPVRVNEFSEITLPPEVVNELGLNTAIMNEIDYERAIRFPNLSSIAAARFAHDDRYQGRGKLAQYWHTLARSIRTDLGETERRRFAARTRGRSFQVPKTDRQINPDGNPGWDYNGVMFSSKWLADEMGLDRDGAGRLRGLVEKAHRESGFGDGSPSDWWAIVLGDGDGMGEYVSGKKLHPYERYLIETDPTRFIGRERYRDLDEEEYRSKEREFFAQFGGNGESEGATLLGTRKRMGPATHVGLNRALLDFSNRIVPYLTEHRFCGRVIYSGGDDVMAVLPLEDLPEYLLSLRSAWCGQKDPYGDRDPDVKFIERGGYWQPTAKQGDRQGLPDRPLFTMGEGATMSFGIVIAYKSVPLPVVLNALWEAEKERAKKMRGTGEIPSKDGLCFRVLYGSGNCLEALMKGHLLDGWWRFVNTERRKELGSLLYRLSEELPRHAAITPDHQLVARAAGAIANRRDDRDALDTLPQLIEWLERWETWAYGVEEAWTRSQQTEPGESYPLGITLAELADLLRFTAFWLDKMEQRVNWLNSEAR